MEDIIKKIMAIDRKASDIMRQTEEYLETKEKDIKGKIDAMRSEIMDKTKSETKALFDSVVKEAEVEAGKINGRTKADCDDIESKFMKIREKLETQLFSHIFR